MTIQDCQRTNATAAGFGSYRFDSSPVFPSDPLSQWSGSWYVAACPQREVTALADELQSAGLRSYIPLEEVRRVQGGRSRWVKRQRFPGYLPVCCVCEGHLEDLYSNRRIYREGILTVPNGPLRDRFVSQLSDLQRVLELDPRVSTIAHLVKGTAVEIKRGPLKDVRGVITDNDSRSVVYLNVEMFGRATPIEIEADNVEPI